MSGRRKAVPCSLCREDTFDSDAVCRGCRHAYETGKQHLEDIEKARGEGDKIKIAVPGYMRFNQQNDEQLPYSTSDIHRPLREAILSIFNFEELERYSGADRKVGFYPGQDNYSSDRMTFLASPSDADKLEELIRLIRSLASANHRDGYKSGSDMLGRLANGDLTIAQLTKLK
jgi:hypothetical protein